MKIKKSKLKSIILEEISSYAVEIRSFDLLIEAISPGSKKLVAKIEKLYKEKFGEIMPGTGFMAMSAAKQEEIEQEMKKEETFLLWLQPDDINRFRWIASHYILGTEVKEFTEGDIEHFALKVLPRIGSEKFLYYLRFITGTMINMFFWKSPLKPYAPEDRTKIYPTMDFLKDFSDRVYDKYEKVNPPSPEDPEMTVKTRGL